MTAPPLRVIPGGLSRHLPRAWDGTPIVWGPWTTPSSTLHLHLDDERRACQVCGDADTFGIVCTVLIGPHLTAIRCRSCSHDAVVDADGNVWDLGPEDYGPAGSSMDPADHYHWEVDDQ